MTDRAARFSLSVPPGSYQIDAGFYEVHPTREVAVSAGQHLTLDLKVMMLGQCLSVIDRISTPMGLVPIYELHAGMMVWSVDTEGHRVAAALLLVSHRPAQPGQRMIHLVLSDGRFVDGSAGHPTVDGRHIGDLQPGDMFDGSLVVSVESSPYVGETWDILPASATGTYWANGIMLASTLTPVRVANR